MITIYTSPTCMQCIAIAKTLDKANAEYQKVDITEDEQAKKKLESLGYKSLPVVTYQDETFTGFRPDLIRKFINHQTDNK